MGKELGGQLAKLRVDKDMLRQDVEALVRLKEGVVQRIEDGESLPSYAILARMAAAYGVNDLTELVTLRDNEQLKDALASAETAAADNKGAVELYNKAAALLKGVPMRGAEAASVPVQPVVEQAKQDVMAIEQSKAENIVSSDNVQLKAENLVLAAVAVLMDGIVGYLWSPDVRNKMREVLTESVMLILSKDAVGETKEQVVQEVSQSAAESLASTVEAFAVMERNQANAGGIGAEQSAVNEKKDEPAESKPVDVYETKITDIGLTSKAFLSLNTAGAITIGDIVKYDEIRAMEFPRFGVGMLAEVSEKLAEYGVVWPVPLTDDERRELRLQLLREVPLDGFYPRSIEGVFIRKLTLEDFKSILIEKLAGLPQQDILSFTFGRRCLFSGRLEGKLGAVGMSTVGDIHNLGSVKRVNDRAGLTQAMCVELKDTMEALGLPMEDRP